MKLDRFKIRRWMIAVLVLGIFGIYVARLISVQIVNAEEIRRRLDTGYVSTQKIPAVRGEIVDRNGVPLVVNKLGYDVIIDKVSFPQSTQNSVILTLTDIFEKNGAAWIDSLPITASAPFEFLSGHEAEIESLKEHLKIQQYATVEDALFHLSERYRLQDYSPAEVRRIAGIRYEMERRGFDINVLYTFATDIDIDLVLKVKEQSYQLPGVDIQESALRSFERGDLAPHIIGRTGPIYQEEWQQKKSEGYAMDDTLGKSGVELAMESELRGEKGERRIVLDDRQRVVGAEEAIQAIPGNTVYLTIDAGMQELLQKALEAQILRLQQTARPGEGKEADRGAAVVVECKTGEILACATWPSYDQETYSRDYESLASDTERRPLVNLALHGVYAPGSVFKPVVGTAGMSTGTIEVDTRYLCTRVYSRFTSHRFTCLGYHGSFTLSDALRRSCNIFFYETGYNVGIEKIDLTAKQYGLGEPTGIEISEEIGQRSNRENFERITGEQWTSGNVVQTSIGQLVAQYTPLQMANYAATIANRGKRMELTIIKEVRDYARETVVSSHEPEVADVVDGERSDFEAVVDGMVLASRPTGTAAATFGSYPIDVASKTGTPEARMLNSTFIAFAPAQNPQIAISVVIENGYHGYTGAPVARAIFDEYFGFENPNPLVPRDVPEELPTEADIIAAASGAAGESSAADSAETPQSQGEGAQSQTAQSAAEG